MAATASPSSWNQDNVEGQSQTRPTEIHESSWFQVAQERGPRRAHCRLGLDVSMGKCVHMNRTRHNVRQEETKTTVVAEYVTVARDHSKDAKILLDTSVRQPTERVEHTHQLSIRAAQSPRKARH